LPVYLFDLLLLGVGADVLDVVGAEALDRVLVGADRPLDLALDDVLVLLLDDAEQLAVALLVSSSLMSEWWLSPPPARS
jgi:hypothetical protein